jgi:hypothetical protein
MVTVGWKIPHWQSLPHPEMCHFPLLWQEPHNALGYLAVSQSESEEGPLIYKCIGGWGEQGIVSNEPLLQEYIV